jgi:hypothetical protein
MNIIVLYYCIEDKTGATIIRILRENENGFGFETQMTDTSNDAKIDSQYRTIKTLTIVRDGFTQTY